MPKMTSLLGKLFNKLSLDRMSPYRMSPYSPLMESSDRRHDASFSTWQRSLPRNFSLKSREGEDIYSSPAAATTNTASPTSRERQRRGWDLRELYLPIDLCYAYKHILSWVTDWAIFVDIIKGTFPKLWLNSGSNLRLLWLGQKSFHTVLLT